MTQALYTDYGVFGPSHSCINSYKTWPICILYIPKAQEIIRRIVLKSEHCMENSVALSNFDLPMATQSQLRTAFIFPQI